MDLEDYWSAYWAEGSEEMRQRLLLQYSPLVKFVAPRLSEGSEEATRLGLERLSAAIEDYSPDCGKFESYAVDCLAEAYSDPTDWDVGWSEVG